MRKIFSIILISIITILVAILIFLSTSGIRTDNFNSLINEKVKEIDPKIKLKLNQVNFKLNPSNFEFEIFTLDPQIAINQKNIDLENIRFDLNIFDYISNKNPISEISIISKENDINQFTNFINEYDFNLARNLILKQIKKGKVKIISNINFNENNPKNIKYIINGYVTDAEIKLPNQSKIENIKFDFLVDQDVINLNDIELSFDKFFIASEKIRIKKINNDFEISGNFKTNETKINLNNYRKFININLDLIDDSPINLSSENELSFKINKKLKIKDLSIISKLNFDKLFTKSKYQDFIYFKNGNIIINYIKDELKIVLNSKFLFKNNNNNNNKTKNLINIIYKKKQNKDALVNIDLSNTKSIINSKEFKKFVQFKNFSLQDQDIIFSSENLINFKLNKKNEIQNLSIKSKLKSESILIDYKSQRIKKYFSDFKNQIKFSNSHLNLDYQNKKFKFNLNSKYSINNINENLSLKVEKKDNKYFFDLDLDLDSAEIDIEELDYRKKADIKSNLNMNGIYKDNNEIIFKNIDLNEEEKSINVENLEIGKNDKIKSLDLFKIDIVNKNGKENKLEFKKVNNNYYLTGSQFDGSKNIKNLLDNSSKSIFSSFKNLNTYIYLDIGKYFVDSFSHLSNVKGDIQLKNNKVFSSNINAKLDNNRKFALSIFTNDKKQKITNLEIEQPEPFIKNFKFIKGFKEGKLIYEALNYEGKTKSNLKIIDFKVQEVPVLAKLLTLASLQGIADLLTGEGIRFTDFEMDYETLGNNTKIKEMYAIGPAISVMMEGYIVKDELTSLKGTLVPATTVNKTISKIPMLGDILVGKKIGEGVFGVSFKIKGPPKKLKSTVNPIKTLTPRFITRTLEKIAN
ncbi:hypothetical protein AKH19_03720 [Pelagibacteraceae bacterium GOM-A1]|nr:hypothetical protein AKH19_03720 [Pelagibacteraceae bacterium GOM-A1]